MNTRANRKVQSDAPNVTGRHAVVLGGSLAGLLAARILSDHFDRVTLLERDAYPENSEVRKGIPQANHVHGLLLRGRQVFEELFPGVQDEMIAGGAPLVDMANELALVNKAPWLMATGEDYRYKEVAGGSPGVMTKFMHWYIDRVLRLATREVEVRNVLLHVFSMLLPPSTLFRRDVLVRVLHEAIRPAPGRNRTPRTRRQLFI